MGEDALFAALVVSSDFRQDDEALQTISNEFLADHKVPVAFLEAETLREMVGALREDPHTRNKIRWARVFSGGRVSPKLICREIAEAKEETLSRDGY